ncbi:MAG: PilZ domain-containing protein [Alphaproteobacteria bacterium]|jgi:hypothetical protein|nr:PilZ domain-containing protein [Alphaproteobacteria bacterium]MDP6566851.1 PilZ domain-containing protein [Alphaproteobacteria bacterium]MDP6813451.1 PilZ domain-containing protein [Alphaproteobacteria bacterium]
MPDQPAGSEERRKSVRQDTDREVVVQAGEDTSRSRLKNISDGGALVETDLQLEPDGEVTLLVPGQDIQAVAGVRRIAGKGAGVEFDDAMIGQIIGGWAAAPTPRDD